MLEISGLSIRGNQLHLVSDKEHNVLKFDFEEENGFKLNSDSRSTVNLELNIPVTQGADWEAVTVAESGDIFLVKESSEKIYHYSSGGKLLKKYALGSWPGRKNPKRGFEGIFLLDEGHFLVALETEPATLIEYGPQGSSPVGYSMPRAENSGEFTPPPGSELYPLASWSIERPLGACAYSDLAKGPGGGLYILMKGCGKIAFVERLSPSEPTFSLVETWSLPSEIVHPEGLEVLPSGDFVIASDHKALQKNLYFLKRH